MHKKGFTLVEALVVTTIAGAGAVAAISYQGEEAKKLKASNFIQEMGSIVNGVDSRIAIDGYNEALWSKKSWANESEVTKDLIAKQLIAVDSNCSGGTWSPQMSSEKKSSLIKCGLWKKRNSYDVDMKAEMTPDPFGYIVQFELLVSFNDKKELEDNFMYLKKAVREVSIKNKREFTGRHEYSFVSKTNPTNLLTSVQCVTNHSDCAFKVEFTRSGGAEYLKADGSNSMIADHLTFIETLGQAPLKCIRWKNSLRDGTGVWTKEAADDCGVGIYKPTGSPISLDVVADTGTFKNMLLDQTCNVFEWNGSSVVFNGKTSPCGTTNDGTSVYQVVENSIAELATFKELNTDTAKMNEAEIDRLTVSVATIDELVTPLVNAEVVNVSRELNVGGIANFKKLVEFEDNVTFNEKASFLEGMDVKMKANFDDVEVAGVFTAEQLDLKNLNVSETTKTKDLIATNVSSSSATISTATISSIQGNSLVMNAAQIGRLNGQYASATSRMSAPVGDFANINNELAMIKSAINDLASTPTPTPPPLKLVKQYVLISSKEERGGSWNNSPKINLAGDSCTNVGQTVETSKVIGTSGNYPIRKVYTFSCQLIEVQQ